MAADFSGAEFSHDFDIEDGRAMELSEFINSEPANATRTAAEKLTWLLEPVNQFKDVPWLDFEIWRHQQGVTSTLLQSLVDGANDARSTAAQFMLDVVSAGMMFEATDSRVRQLIIDAQLPSAMLSSLNALATEQVERWRSVRITLNGRPVSRMTLSSVEGTL